MDISLEYYKIFYYVASYKSITLAAEKLSISAGGEPGGETSRERAIMCAVCQNFQGSAFDKRGRGTFFVRGERV